MKRFATSTAEEAQAYLDEFTCQQGDRLEELRELIETTGGASAVVLDRTVASLVPLWTWALSQLGNPEPVPEPTWFSLSGAAAGGLTPHDLVLAEYIGRYIAEVMLTTVPGSRWTVIDGRPDLFDYHQPAVTAPGYDYLPAIGVGIVQVLRARRRGTTPDALVTVLRNHRVPSATTER